MVKVFFVHEINRALFESLTSYVLQNTCKDLLLVLLPFLKTYNFITERLQSKCFSVNFAKYLRTPLLKNICKNWFCLFHIYYKVLSSSNIGYKELFPEAYFGFFQID